MKIETTNDHDLQNAHRYTEIANYYRKDWRGELSPDLIDKYQIFLEMLGKGKKQILDVGCGTGKASLFFAKLGHQVFSLDLSTGMLRETINQKEDDCDLDGTLADMKRLPFPNNSIDGLWTMAAVVHLQRQGRKTAFGDFFRVLKPNGVLGLSAQNRLHPKHMQRIFQSCFFDIGYDNDNRYYQKLKQPADIVHGFSIMRMLIDGYAFMDGRHWYFPTMKELNNSLSEVGFSVKTLNSPLERRIDILAVKK
jgi:ubiquinone/menaquinone biosynthesis C-methylase UbiE